MAQRVSFPTDSLQELLDLHAACEREAIAIFMERSFKDDDQMFQKKLVEIIQGKKDGFLLQQNEEASVKYCQAKLDQLSVALLEGISAGTFYVPGGHKLYLETKEKIEEDYFQVPRKGVKVQEDMIKDGFMKKAEEMNDEINYLKKVISATQKDNSPWIARAIDRVGTEITSILSAPAKLIGNIVSAFGSLFHKNESSH
uniref:Guanylate-binding protein/Atlastin C-terminal domain-containing protein n=1 Tax=Molossus molossus TaxID=27622 RepID=A0A7J8F8X9_MOLMO|nr:hypothetical protein HJG59_008523 [Molossus molossus]